MRIYAGRKVGPVWLGVGFSPRFGQIHTSSSFNAGFLIGVPIGLLLIFFLLAALLRP
jgi:hypothetical protein